MRLSMTASLGLPGLIAVAFACSANEERKDNFGDGGASGSGAIAGSGGTIGVTGGTSGSGGTLAGDASGGTGARPDACAAVSSQAEILTVTLVFAFDVSGSMGKGDEDWHDQTLKWDPVAAATKAFFSDPESAGLTASLTFFPEGGGDEDVRCVDANYVTPDVPLTELPSPAFGTALDVIPTQAWRGGTPTLHVINGVITFAQQQTVTRPGKYAIVLVTDGYPQDCPDNNITSVANAVAAVATTIPTYVIGIENPPSAPIAQQTLENLQQVAAAGGTGKEAFLIDTGDPTVTANTFKTAINEIRGAAQVSCTVPIPAAPPDRAFDKEKVEVKYASGTDPATTLVYDPACTQPNAWRYDDPANPTQIILCDSTCATVQGDLSAGLTVDFPCERVIDIPD